MEIIPTTAQALPRSLVLLVHHRPQYVPAGLAACAGKSAANQTFCLWAADTFGANVGDTLTGKHWSSFTQVNDPITHVGKDDFYNDDFAAYLEDTWKVRPSLTLNLGVRYDLQHVPAPPQPNTASPLLTLYTSTLNIDKNNIAPRIGFAWQFAKNTVLRGGYGMFYGKTSNSTYYALRVENGVFQQTFAGCLPTTCGPTFPQRVLHSAGARFGGSIRGRSYTGGRSSRRRPALELGGGARNGSGLRQPCRA